jgi:hypothetical protein
LSKGCGIIEKHDLLILPLIIARERAAAKELKRDGLRIV